MSRPRDLAARVALFAAGGCAVDGADEPGVSHRVFSAIAARNCATAVTCWSCALDARVCADATSASVSTRVVSWKDAAEMKLRVCKDALVMPNSTGLAVATRLPAFSIAAAAVRIPS